MFFSGIFNFTVGILRRIHRDRQRLVQHLGGSGPSTALESPQLTESSSSEAGRGKRIQNDENEVKTLIITKKTDNKIPFFQLRL